MKFNPSPDTSPDSESYEGSEWETFSSTSLALSDLFSALFLILIALIVVALIQLQEAKREQQLLAHHIRSQVGIYRVTIDQITQIKERLIQENIPVEVNQKTGEVIIRDDGVMFAVKSARLSQVAQQFLKRFARVYFEVVLSDQFVEQIRWIVVEGHASAEGEEIFNLDLSTQRAQTVSAFLLSTLTETVHQELKKQGQLSANDLLTCQSQACLRLKRLKDRLLVAGRGEFSAHQQVDIHDRSVRFRLHFKSDLFDLYEDKETQRLIWAPHQ